jgi:hypothetical protein
MKRKKHSSAEESTHTQARPLGNGADEIKRINNNE